MHNARVTSTAASDITQPDAPSAPDGGDLPLPCPNCGYDLRGNTSGRCPECGVELDAEVFSARAAIPWQERAKVGRVRAFLRTTWLALRHPGRLARQAAREVSYRDARRFQLVCCVLAWLCVAPLLLVLWHEWYDGFWPASGSWRVAMADGSIFLAGALGLFLWMLLATGLPSYFFHPKDRPRPLQDRAIALSYYSAAPLALVPVASLVTVVAVVLLGTWGDRSPPILVEAGAMLVVGSAWLLVISELIALPGILLKKGLHAGPGRLLACGIVLCAGWPLLFVLTALGLPFLVFYVQLAWHALR